jgi:small GTP-binding protein
VVAEFDTLQAQLGYTQAQDTVRSLVDRLQLSPREAHALAPEIARLSGLVDKIDQTVIHIAVFGLVGRGKSSVLNGLLGSEVFATGPTHGVTQSVTQTAWHLSEEALASGQSLWRVALPGQGQSRIELIDTPGLDEVNGADRERLAQEVARSADLILFVVAGDITRVEYDALVALRQASKPMVLVFNKVDQYPDRDRQAIYATLRDQRLRDLISPEEIVMTAAAPLVTTATRQANGRLVTQRRRGQPQVADLKLKILEVLHQEGLSLVALNTLLYADEVNETIVAKKLQIRDRAAEDVIWSGVMTKAIAVALNPITGIDLLTGAAVDVALVVALSRLYGLPMTPTGALKLLRTVALQLGGLSVSELLVTFGLSSLKGLLGAATPVTGGLSLPPYVSVAVTQAAVAGVASYSIGQVTRSYLVNGATWGPQGPKVAVQEILAHLDEGSILHRIKAELQAKLTPLTSTGHDFPGADFPGATAASPDPGNGM